jgi:hypothetical protein
MWSIWLLLVVAEVDIPQQGAAVLVDCLQDFLA